MRAGELDRVRLTRPAGIRSLRLGELTVSYVPDGDVPLRPRGWLPASTEQDWAAHPEFLDDAGDLIAGIGGLLVERGDRALLIDTGYGPHETPAHLSHPLVGTLRGGMLLDSLAALGRRPADIDTIAFTHLHDDHAGWAFHLDPEPLFRNARYVLAEAEWTQWTASNDVADLAGRVRFSTADEEIFPGVTVLPTPGHTLGHNAFRIVSNGQRLIAFGDVMHSPIQVSRPDWNAGVDADPALALRSRETILAELEVPGTLGFGGHFADVVFGRVARSGDHRFWQAEP